MSLSYHFEFAAPAKDTPKNLEEFLRKAEATAKKLGFSPTLVLKADFNTPEQRQFAQRLTYGQYFEAPELKSVLGLSEQDATRYDPDSGSCRLLPRRAVVLIVTDERGSETIFGFCQWPAEIRDTLGKPVHKTGLDGNWQFRDFVDSPDPRYRQVVKMFADAGYLVSEKDEFNPS